MYNKVPIFHGSFQRSRRLESYNSEAHCFVSYNCNFLILECTCEEKENNEETRTRSRKYFAQINCLAREVLFGLDNNVSYVLGSTVQSQTKQGGLGKIFYLMCMHQQYTYLLRVLKLHAAAYLEVMAECKSFSSQSTFRPSL